VDGRRVGLVDYTVCDTTGATIVRYSRAVVPEQALRARETEQPR
jgi:hypothetical protein